MKINCIMGPYLPMPAVQGGACEKIFLALCEEFARRGHEVTIISRQFGDFPHQETLNGIRHIRVKSRNQPASKLFYRIFDILYAFHVRAALPKADITITNSVSMPLIISRRQAGKIYVDVARYPKQQMAMYRRVDRLQACSTHIARAICEQSPSVAHLVKAIPNAITSIFAAKANSPSEKKRAKEIIFVGRVAREKGIHLLIRAFSLISVQFPDWRLVVVGPHLEVQGGDGETFLNELKKEAKETSERIEFVGPIFDDIALAARYARSAIFVYPSVAERGEAFPVAPLEAMACGCAPIVSDLRCFDDAIEPEHNGLSFDHRDASGAPLASALTRLIECESFRSAIAERAHSTSKRYVPAAVATLFIEDFEALLTTR